VVICRTRNLDVLGSNPSAPYTLGTYRVCYPVGVNKLTGVIGSVPIIQVSLVPYWRVITIIIIITNDHCVRNTRGTARAHGPIARKINEKSKRR